MTERSRRRYSRRGAIRLGLAAGGAGLLLGCGARDVPPLTPEPDDREQGRAARRSVAPAPERTAAPRAERTPRPTPTPRPVPPAARETRVLLPDTEWAAEAGIVHSGAPGPRLLVLGGVHGNEPGSWIAAEAMTEWEVRRGSLAVVPRANVIATRVLERTLPELGDLNRLYPGAEDAELPMERMAHAIVDLARSFGADMLIDMHESWGFYRERGDGQRGTAFLGQTLTSGGGASAREVLSSLVETVNGQLTEREQFVLRTRLRWRRRGLDLSDSRRGSSSLSLGTHVRGMLPLLVEVGQQGQPVERRAEIHRLLVQTALEQHDMV